MNMLGNDYIHFSLIKNMRRVILSLLYLFSSTMASEDMVSAGNLWILSDNINNISPLAIESWQTQAHNFDIKIFDHKQASSFISSHFSKEVFTKFESLSPPLKYKFWSACVIWRFGGIYMDKDIVLKKPLRTFLKPNDVALLSSESSARNGFDMLAAREKDRRVSRFVVHVLDNTLTIVHARAFEYSFHAESEKTLNYDDVESGVINHAIHGAVAYVNNGKPSSVAIDPPRMANDQFYSVDTNTMSETYLEFYNA